MKLDKKFMLITIFLIVLMSVASLASPILLNFLNSSDNGLSESKILILFLVMIFSLSIELILILIREKFSENYNIENFKKMINSYFKLNYDTIIEQGPTNLIERIIIAVNSVYMFMTGDYIKIWSSIFIMCGILLLTCFNNIYVGLIMFFMLPINYFGFRMLNKELMNRSKVMQEATSLGWQKIISIFNQTDYIKQSYSYVELIKQLNPTLKNIYGSMASVNILAQTASSLIHGLNYIAKTMIVVLVSLDVFENKNGFFSLIMFTIIIPIYFENVQLITRANLNKRDMVVALDFLKSWENLYEQSGTKKIDKIESVQFDIKSLIVGEKEICCNINGKYKIGDIIWVRGDSGTGKSTLLKLLSKFRLSDKILLNGIDIRNIENSSVRKRIRYLSQEVPIIKGTLRENIFFNVPYNKSIEEDLKDSFILKSIMKNKTMDSMIDENGGNLSGGEKQKIAISRLLLDESDVLILDEITSNIDRESSFEIMKEIEKLSKDKIIFITSHDDFVKDYVNTDLVLKGKDKK